MLRVDSPMRFGDNGSYEELSPRALVQRADAPRPRARQDHRRMNGHPLFITKVIFSSGRADSFVRRLLAAVLIGALAVISASAEARQRVTSATLPASDDAFLE